MGKSRAVIVAVICLTTLLLPALLCLGLALVPARSALELGLLTAAAAALWAAMALVLWWEFSGLVLRGVCSGLLLAVAVGRWAAPPAGSGVGLAGLLAGLLVLVGAAVVVPALRARRHPGEAVDLLFPLRGGRFLVTDGGDGAASFLVNYHFGFAGHRGKGVSGSMRYATDVVEVGALGVEAPWLVPARNEAYRIWGRAVHAPCDGLVVKVVDEVADNSAFGPDRPYGVGNQVVIRAAGDVHVVLGHLRRGSVAVQAGQAVRAGQPVGRVGNSGWTERPHLHFQAMRAPDGDFWHGAPLPMRFGGRFLVKNQVVRTPAVDGAET